MAVIDGDTLCLITARQVKFINESFVVLSDCQIENDTLYSIIESLKLASAKRDKLMSNLRSGLQSKEMLSKEKDELILFQDKKLKYTADHENWLKTSRLLCAGAAVLFAGAWLAK